MKKIIIGLMVICLININVSANEEIIKYNNKNMTIEIPSIHYKYSDGTGNIILCSGSWNIIYEQIDTDTMLTVPYCTKKGCQVCRSVSKDVKGTVPIYKDGIEASNTIYNYGESACNIETAKTIKFGKYSTEIKLDSSNGAIEDDDGFRDYDASKFYIFGGGYSQYYPTVSKWNISMIPDDMIIDNAIYYVKQYSGSNVDGLCYEYYYREWDGISENTNSTAIGNYISDLPYNFGSYASCNITSWVNSEYLDNYDNFTIHLQLDSSSEIAYEYNSLQFIYSHSRPYVNITYSEDEEPPPSGNCWTNNGKMIAIPSGCMFPISEMEALG